MGYQYTRSRRHVPGGFESASDGPKALGRPFFARPSDFFHFKFDFAE